MLVQFRIAFVRFVQRVALGVFGVLVITILSEVAPGALKLLFVLLCSAIVLTYLITGHYPWEKRKLKRPAS